MRTLLFLIAVVWLVFILTGCSDDNNTTYPHAKLLMEHDGCKVFQMRPCKYCDSIYVSKCTNAISSQTDDIYRSGKTTRHDRVETEYK